MADNLLSLSFEDVSYTNNLNSGKRMVRVTKKEMLFHLYLMRIHFHMTKLLVVRGLSAWVVKFSKH